MTKLEENLLIAVIVVLLLGTILLSAGIGYRSALDQTYNKCSDVKVNECYLFAERHHNAQNN